MSLTSARINYWALVAIVSIMGSVAQARVFDMNSSWVSAYFRGVGGMVPTHKDMYADTSGSATNFSEGIDYGFGGELGFSFALNEKMTLRLGFEGYQPKDIVATGKHGTTKVMDVESSASIFSPALTFEMTLYGTNKSKAFLFLGGNYSTVTVNNEYSLTAAGTAAYTGAPATYKETWVATTESFQLGIGYEMYMLDNVTVSFEGGYRSLDIPRFEYDETVTGVRNSSATSLVKGQMVTSNSNEKISLDYSGPFVGLTLKFYIPPLD